MGVQASKFGQQIEQEKPTEGSLPSTPILTPKTRLVNLNDLDPRSPSDNIVRTPIQVLLANSKRSVLEVDNEPSPAENNCDTFNIYSPGVKLKDIDPRSPTVEFTRTPIIVPENIETLPVKLHNKNLDNVRKTLIHTPLTKAVRKTSSEKIISPRLLESNLITPRLSENKRKSYVGLLETNLDYVETDLDNVRQNISDNSLDDDCKSLSKDSDDGSEADVSEPISQTEVVEEFLTPDVKRKSLTYEVDCAPTENLFINNSIDPRSPTNEFIRTPLQILQNLERLEIAGDSTKSPNITQIFTDCDDDDGLQSTISHKSTVKNRKGDKCQSKVENVKDFDKKLSNLIHEDKERSESAVKNRKPTEPRSRTPLGTRNSNANPKRGIAKLRVHDKPQKGAKEISKIPVFQNKKGKGKINPQCENTPPINLEDNSKFVKHKWDPNNTLII